MSFYLLPPEGIAPYKKLEEYGLTRLHFLVRLIHCRNSSEVDDVIQDTYVVDHSDCLINGTAKDNISHYILRLLIGGCSETAAFFHESESTFFRLQLERMDKEELIDFFQYLEKTLMKLKVQCCYKSPMSSLLSLVQVLKKMFSSWAQVAESICDENCNVSVCLPFHMALRLVAGHMVDLNKGMVTVPLRFMRELLLQQYDTVMKAFIQQARTAREIAIKDQRIKRLAAVFKRAYRSEIMSSIGGPKHCQPIRLPSLSSATAMFPPCMNHLMKVLRQYHRLKHHDRIQLTLFLKELGLPLHDALLLWKHEYSKYKSFGNHKGWQGNEKRYIYNIRHLYGLEGGMINYRAHSCCFIQGRSLSLGDHGGCPFVSKDKTVLSSLTEELGLELHDIPVFERLIESQDYTAACQLYMCIKKLQIFKDDDIKTTKNNNHCKENTTKKGSAVIEHKARNEPSKLFCTFDRTFSSNTSLIPGMSKYNVSSNNCVQIYSKPNKDMLATSAKKHSKEQSLTLNSDVDGFLKDDMANNMFGSIRNIALKKKPSKSHPDYESLNLNLTEYNCSNGDLPTTGHSSSTNVSLATETCTEAVPKGRHIQLIFGRHIKPSECFWSYNNNDYLQHGSHAF